MEENVLMSGQEKLPFVVTYDNDEEIFTVYVPTIAMQEELAARVPSNIKSEVRFVVGLFLARHKVVRKVCSQVTGRPLDIPSTLQKIQTPFGAL